MLAAHSGRTGAMDALEAHFEAIKGLRVRADFVEGVSGVLSECMGHAGGNEVLWVRLGYTSQGRGW